jgi:HEAT repeat protein
LRLRLSLSRRARPEPATSGELIRELGLTMVEKDADMSSEAVRALSLIADERVIPWYVKALDTNRYELKMAALDRLSRFQGDSAFRGLIMGMRTQANDIGNCSSEAVAKKMAENVRHAAAGALARSPHAEAKRLLLTMWDDPSRAVRITVLHVLGKSNTDDSLGLLKKMSEDVDEGVRDEALRYLQLRAAE